MNLIKRLKGNKTLLNGSMFSLFSFVNQGISFLLLLLLANYIAPAEYGKLSLFNTIVQFMCYFVALSSQGYLSVSYFKRGQQYFKGDFSSICIISLCVTSFFCLVCLIGGKWISSQSELPFSFLWIAILISFFQVFQSMWLDLFRIKEKVGKYGIISCSTAILNLLLSLFLVIKVGLNWEGRVYAHVLCTLLFCLMGLIYFARQKMFTSDVTWDNIKMIALWGIPLIPHLASAWIKQGCDRFVINHFYSIEDVGLFSFALNLTSIIIILGSSFNSSNSVSIYKILSDKITVEQKRTRLKRQTRNIAIIYIVASLCIVTLAAIIVPILLPRYTTSIPYFLILSIQGLGQCFYFLFSNYLFYYSKNKMLMNVTFFTSLFHLGLSLTLTRYSLYLTCIIYVITQLIVTLLIWRISQRLLNESFVEE